MRKPILFQGIAVAICSLGIVFLAPGCNDSSPSEPTYDNMLTNAQASRTLSADPVAADAGSGYAGIMLTAADPTVTDPPKFHVASGPDKTSYVTGTHITEGADKSMYIVTVHVISGADESTYKRVIYEHITEGADKSSYKPKGGVHVDEGPNISSYIVPATGGVGVSN